MIGNHVFALCPLKPLQLGFDIRYCRLPLQVRCTMPTGSLLVSWVQADALANYKSLDDIMSVTRYIFVMMMMTTLLGMALGCLLAWCCCCPRPCVDAVRPRPCVNTGHDAGTTPLGHLTPDVVASSLSASSSSAPAAPLPVGATCGWVSDGGRRFHRREDCSGLRFARNIKRVDACKICG